MSFGIYNAFIFDRNYTMQELIKMMDFLRKEVRKPIDAQLHKYVLEKFLYYYYLRERLYGDEILEMLKKETDYDKKNMAAKYHEVSMEIIVQKYRFIYSK